jgi:hypothetical protein
MPGILFLSALCLLPSDGTRKPGDVRFPKLLGAAFQRYHSAHFEIFTDAPSAVLRRVQDLAEETHGMVSAWASKLGSPAGDSTRLMTIVLFKDQRAFSAFVSASGLNASPDIPGYFDERNNYCAILDIGGLETLQRKRDELFIARREVSNIALNSNPDAQRAGRHRLDQIQALERQIEDYEKAINSTVIRHEIAHLVLFNRGLQRAEDKNRRWLKEGLATQFECPTQINTFRLADFRQVPINEQKSMMRRLITDPSQIGPGADRPAQAYAIAWALVYFLRDEKAAAFNGYLAEKNSVPTENELERFERRFGTLDDEFVRKLNDFIAKKAT